MLAEVLDKNPRPGTKVYARYKDALLGCFKKGRYRHFSRAEEVCLPHQLCSRLLAAALAQLADLQVGLDNFTDARPVTVLHQPIPANPW